MRKLHVYALVNYKGEESRIVKIYGNRNMAVRAKSKCEFKLHKENNLPKYNKKKNDETFHVLKFTVAGAKLDTNAAYKKLFLWDNENILSVYEA